MDGCHRHDVAERRVAGAGETTDRVEFLRLDLAVAQQALAEMEDAHLADEQAAARLAELEAVPETALHGHRSLRQTRHGDMPAWLCRQAEEFGFAHLGRMLDGVFVQWSQQRPVCDVHDELLAGEDVVAVSL